LSPGTITVDDRSLRGRKWIGNENKSNESHDRPDVAPALAVKAFYNLDVEESMSTG